jgi:DsbC/DsbD-like thiol-disulfide interchange protein
MTVEPFRQRRAPFAAALVLGGILGCCLGATGPARADDASAWDTDIHSALRLIAGSSPKDGGALLRAGVQLRLDPGWKTYWRYPGDSGVPPRFDFGGSENVKSVTVLWPAPRRFPDGAGGNSIGYTEAVIFPVHVEPREPGKPVALRLKADYAICEKLCVPAEGKAELNLTRGPAAEDSSLAAAEARVPKPFALGKGGAMTIRAARRELANGRARVVVDVAAPDESNLDLFIEGPTPDWALPLPEPLAGAPAGARRFAFDVDGVPPGAKIEGAQLKLTLVAGDHAIEVSTHLD